MSEYEILDLAKQAENAIPTFMQWWGSVSLGLIALAHFASRRLNKFLVVLVVTLYTAFTVQAFLRMQENAAQYANYIDDLKLLQASGVPLSSSTVHLVERATSDATSRTLGGLSLLVLVPGIYLGSIGYLVYVNIRERKRLDRREG